MLRQIPFRGIFRSFAIRVPFSCRALACALLCLLFQALGARAQESADYLQLPMDTVDDTHDYLSRGVENAAQNLDVFFGGERVLEESTGSLLRIRGWWFTQRGDTPEFKFNARLKLVLPKTQERLHFELSSDPAPEETEEQQGLSETDLSHLKTVEDFFAGLKAVFFDTDQWHADMRAGVRLKFPVDPYLRAFVRRTDHLGSWKLRFQQEGYWYNSSGYGARTTLYFDRPLEDTLLFRLASTATWEEETLAWSLGEALEFFRRLDEADALAYRTGVRWGTRPVTRPEQYFLDFTWRRLLYSDWLFLDVRPGMTWRRERQFRPDPGFLLRLEAFFGQSTADLRADEEARRREEADAQRVDSLEK